MMGLLCHPEGFGQSTSEVDEMEFSDMLFWHDRMSDINRAILKNIEKSRRKNEF